MIAKQFGSRARRVKKIGLDREKFALRTDTARTRRASAKSGKRGVSVVNIKKPRTDLIYAAVRIFSRRVFNNAARIQNRNRRRFRRNRNRRHILISVAEYYRKRADKRIAEPISDAVIRAFGQRSAPRYIPRAHLEKTKPADF
jgi:hypothetical protein